MRVFAQPDEDGMILPADLLDSMFLDGVEVPDPEPLAPVIDPRRIAEDAAEAERLEVFRVNRHLDQPESIWRIPTRRAQLAAAQEIEGKANGAVLQYQRLRSIDEDTAGELLVGKGRDEYAAARERFIKKHSGAQPPETKGEAERRISELVKELQSPPPPGRYYGEAEAHQRNMQLAQQQLDELSDSYIKQFGAVTKPGTNPDAQFRLRQTGLRDILDNPNDTTAGISPILRDVIQRETVKTQGNVDVPMMRLHRSAAEFNDKVLSRLVRMEQVRSAAEQQGMDEIGMTKDRVTGEFVTDPRMTGLIGETKRFGINVKRGAESAFTNASSALFTFVGGGKEESDGTGVRGFQEYMTWLGRELQTHSDSREEGATADASRFAKLAYRATSGAARSATEMGVAAMTGAGTPGIIAYHAFTSSMQAYNSAREMGLSEEDATTHAMTIGTIEGGVTAMFSMAGLGGSEKIISELSRGSIKGASGSGMRAFMLDLGKHTLYEELEENLISMTQLFVSDINKVSPGAFFVRDQNDNITGVNWDGLIDTVFETSLSTVMATAALQTMRFRQYMAPTTSSSQQSPPSNQAAQPASPQAPPAAPGSPAAASQAVAPQPSPQAALPAASPPAAAQGSPAAVAASPQSQIALPVPNTSGSVPIAVASDPISVPQMSKEEMENLIGQRAESGSIPLPPTPVIPSDSEVVRKKPDVSPELPTIDQSESEPSGAPQVTPSSVSTTSSEIAQVVEDAKSSIVALPPDQQQALTELAKEAIVADAAGSHVDITPEAVNEAAPDLAIEPGDTGSAVLAAAAAVSLGTASTKSKSELISRIDQAKREFGMALREDDAETARKRHDEILKIEAESGRTGDRQLEWEQEQRELKIHDAKERAEKRAKIKATDDARKARMAEDKNTAEKALKVDAGEADKSADIDEDLAKLHSDFESSLISRLSEAIPPASTLIEVARAVEKYRELWAYKALRDQITDHVTARFPHLSGVIGLHRDLANEISENDKAIEQQLTYVALAFVDNDRKRDAAKYQKRGNYYGETRERIEQAHAAGMELAREGKKEKARGEEDRLRDEFSRALESGDWRAASAASNKLGELEENDGIYNAIQKRRLQIDEAMESRGQTEIVYDPQGDTESTSRPMPDVLPYPPRDASLADHVSRDAYLGWAHPLVDAAVAKLPDMTPTETLDTKRAIAAAEKTWKNNYLKDAFLSNAGLSLENSGDFEAAEAIEKAMEQIAYKVQHPQGQTVSSEDANKIGFIALQAMLRDKGTTVEQQAAKEKAAELAARQAADAKAKTAKPVAEEEEQAGKTGKPASPDTRAVDRTGESLKKRVGRMKTPDKFILKEAKKIALDLEDGFEATGVEALARDFMPNLMGEIDLAEDIVRRLASRNPMVWQEATDFRSELGTGWTSEMYAARSLDEDGVSIPFGVDEVSPSEAMRQMAALRERLGQWVVAHAAEAQKAPSTDAKVKRGAKPPSGKPKKPRKRKEPGTFDMPAGFDDEVAMWLTAAAELPHDGRKSLDTQRIEDEFPAESIFTDQQLQEDADAAGLPRLSEAYAEALAELDRLGQQQNQIVDSQLEDDDAMDDRLDIITADGDETFDQIVQQGAPPKSLDWYIPRYRNAFRRAPYEFIKKTAEAVSRITGRPWRFEMRFLRPGVSGTTYETSSIARVEPGDWGTTAHEAGHTIGLWLSQNGLWMQPGSNAHTTAQVLGIALYVSRGASAARMSQMTQHIWAHEGVAEWVHRYVMENDSLAYPELQDLTDHMLASLSPAQFAELDALRAMAESHKALSVTQQEGSRFVTTQPAGIMPWLRRAARSLTPQNLWRASSLFRRLDAASKGKGRLTTLFNALARTSGVVANTMIKQHTVNAVGVKNGESLLDIAKDLDKGIAAGTHSEAEFNAYMLALVQDDLMQLAASGQKIETDVGILVSPSDNRVEQIAFDPQNVSKYHSLAQRVNAFVRRVHEYRAGRSTHYHAELQEIDNQMQGAFYVPLRKALGFEGTSEDPMESRNMFAGTKVYSGPSATPARSGAQGEQIINVLETIQNEVGRIVEQGHQREMFEELKNIYDSKTIPEMNDWMQLVADTSGMTPGVAKQLELQSEQTDPNLVAFDEWYTPVDKKGNKRPAKKRTLTFRVDPQIMDDIKDMTRQEMVWMKKMGPVKQMFSSVTGMTMTFALRFNPAYWIRQVMMDAPNLFAKQQKGVTVNPGVFIAKWFHGTMANAFGKDTAAIARVQSEGLEFLRNNGIGDVTTIGYNTSAASANLGMSIRKVEGIHHMLGILAQGWRKTVHVGESLQVGQMATTVEVTAKARGIDLKNGTVTENGVTRPMDKFDAAALVEAARALLPVHDRGRFWRDIEFIMPLGLIAATDAKGTIDAIRRNPTRMGVVMGGLAVMGLLNALRFKDEEWWKRLSAADLLNFWMQPDPTSENGLLAWDMTGTMQQSTFGLGQAFGKVLIESVQGEAEAEDVVEIFRAIASSFLPRSEAPAFDLTVGTVTGSKAPIMSMFGYHDYQIVPYRMKQLPGFQQYTDTTPYLYRHVASMFGRGGSPLMVKHLVDTITGGVVTSAVSNIESGLGYGRELTPHERFAIGRIYIQGGQGGSLNRTPEYARLIAIEAELDSRHARATETPADKQMREMVGNAMETISIMRWMKEKSGKFMPAEERERVDGQASRLAIDTYEAYAKRQYSPAFKQQASQWRRWKLSLIDYVKERDLKEVGLLP